VFDAKKIINILTIISYFGIALIIITVIFYNLNKSPRNLFFCDLVFGIAYLLSIPSIGQGFSIADNKNKIKAKTWFMIYFIFLFLWIILMVYTNFFKKTLDFPYAIREDYLIINSSFERKISFGLSRYIDVNNVRIFIPENHFNSLERNNEYTFHYLPNSKWVIDITDENDNSLSKNKPNQRR